MWSFIGSLILFIQPLEIRETFNTKLSMVYATLGNINVVAWYEKMEGRDKVDFMWRVRVGIDNGLAMKPYVFLLLLRNQVESTPIICSCPLSSKCALTLLHTITT